MMETDMELPRLEPIKNGWAAIGNGWAVHGNTQDEALERYRQAEIRHSEIDRRQGEIIDLKRRVWELESALAAERGSKALDAGNYVTLDELEQELRDF